ncbi:hypothetical protein F4780DRAFT_785416 [Xylariomycetidae sp. FL0641]|nr:hypothetical protein F4780DRAFT_785416 [Xylariomycetidae sp. FL0641]
MKHYLPLDQVSIESLEDDQFYSAPASCISSRHVSVTMPSSRPSEAINAKARPTEPLVSVCDSARLPIDSRQASGQQGMPDIDTRDLGRCLRFEDDFVPGHHHDASKPSTALQPLGSSARSRSHLKSIPMQKSRVSAPAAAVASRDWSSVYLDHEPLLPPCPLSLPGLVETPEGKESIERIVCNIRAYLSDRRHDDGSTDEFRLPSTSQENHLPPRDSSRDISILNDGRLKPPTERYLVTTNDIAGILDIVIAGIRLMHDDSIDNDCLSRLLPQASVCKPSPKLQAIVPKTPSLAEPATTISSVRPSFSMSGGCPGGHRRHHSGSKCTIISRQSITEVN